MHLVELALSLEIADWACSVLMRVSRDLVDNFAAETYSSSLVFRRSHEDGNTKTNAVPRFHPLTSKSILELDPRIFVSA